MARVTNKEVQEWIEMNQSLTVKEIAQKTKRDHKTIRFWFKSVGHTALMHIDRVYRKKFSEAEFIKLHKKFMGNENQTLRNLSEQNGISEQNLTKRFKKLGLPLKGTWPSHLKVKED